MKVHKVGLISTDCLSLSEPINFKKLYLHFDGFLADIDVMDISSQMFPNDPILKENCDQLFSLAKLNIVKFISCGADLDVKYNSPKSREEREFLDSLPSNLSAYSLSKLMTHARKLSLHYQSQGLDIVPVYPSEGCFDPKYDDLVLNKRTEVLRFVFSQLPEPSEDVSWEQLHEFKKDVEIRSKFYRLMNWVNDVSRENLTLVEIRDQYYQLYYDYQQQFKLHKMKYNLGVAEVLVTATSELLSGKFSALASTLSLLSVKRQQIALMESELTMPGKELAYILDSNSKLVGIK